MSVIVCLCRRRAGLQSVLSVCVYLVCVYGVLCRRTLIDCQAERVGSDERPRGDVDLHSVAGECADHNIPRIPQHRIGAGRDGLEEERGERG